MIDLTKKALPNVVYVSGVPYLIKTNFREWMRFMTSVYHMKPGQTIEVGYLFEEECPHHCSISDLLQFGAPKNVLPRSTERSDVISIDYELDGDLIFAAFLGQYGIDLCDIEYLHWHKFIALLSGLNESTKLREVMGYRCYKKSNKKTDEQYEQLKYAWEIVREEETDEEEVEAFSQAFTRKK